MAYRSRQERIAELFPKGPAFRLRQMEAALFQPQFHGWKDVSNLPEQMRNTLEREVPWMSVTTALLEESLRKDTFKAAISVEGGKQIETVLMKNPRGWWTICVSSQVGCAMRCGFCATGKMGLFRSLHADEIVDQYRYWVQFLLEHPELPQRITNVVFMGMGEPMANYEQVRATINTWLKHTELGLTRITVSTVGVLPRLEQLLEDPLWPHVRLAVSLHSAEPITRKQIVPTSYDDFLPKLKDWARRYLKKFGNRRHHLTFEYVMLRKVNDTEAHAKALAEFVNDVGDVRVNLIPYNFTGIEFQSSLPKSVEAFMQLLERHDVTVTKRRTMGEDISAACGQLITLTNTRILSDEHSGIV